MVTGGDQGAVHDEDGTLGEPLALPQRKFRAEVVDTPNSGASCRSVRLVRQ